MEEEEVLSEKTLSDESGEEEVFYSDLETEDGWEDVGPEESASQVNHNTDSEVNAPDSEINAAGSEVNAEGSEVNAAGSEISIPDISMISGSTVWLYFDKSPSYATGFNVCKRCSKRFKVTTSVSTLRVHLKLHQLKAPTKKQTVSMKKKNPLEEEEQKKHDEFLIQWLISDLQPFTVVDNHHFKEFISFFCSRYVIPDRHKVKGKHIIEI